MLLLPFRLSNNESMKKWRLEIGIVRFSIQSDKNFCSCKGDVCRSFYAPLRVMESCVSYFFNTVQTLAHCQQKHACSWFDIGHLFLVGFLLEGGPDDRTIESELTIAKCAMQIGVMVEDNRNSETKLGTPVGMQITNYWMVEVPNICFTPGQPNSFHFATRVHTYRIPRCGGAEESQEGFAKFSAVF